MGVTERKAPCTKFTGDRKKACLINVDRNVNAVENFSNIDSRFQARIALGSVLYTLFVCKLCP